MESTLHRHSPSAQSSTSNWRERVQFCSGHSILQCIVLHLSQCQSEVLLSVLWSRMDFSTRKSTLSNECPCRQHLQRLVCWLISATVSTMSQRDRTIVVFGGSRSGDARDVSYSHSPLLCCTELSVSPISSTAGRPTKKSNTGSSPKPLVSSVPARIMPKNSSTSLVNRLSWGI